MKVKRNAMPGVVEITPQRFIDSRGYFTVPFAKDNFEKNGLHQDFVQDNESFSRKGTFRGLHFQKPPYAQGKLVRVVSGLVQDIIVDLRVGSPTFKKWDSFYLSAETGNMLYVPPGFAHGFVAVEESVFAYKCTAPYNKESEGGIHWADPDLEITYAMLSSGTVRSTGDFIVSEKDEALGSLAEYLADPCFIFEDVHSSA